MSATTILLEVRKLYGVSDRLDSMADQHPAVTEGLLSISGNIRNSAALLEVLVTTGSAGHDENRATFGIAINRANS